MKLVPPLRHPPSGTAGLFAERPFGEAGTPADAVRHRLDDPHFGERAEEHRYDRVYGNRNQVSRLRLVNPAAEPATISIAGVDDAGVAAPEGNITLTMPADAATTITAQQLEAGANHFAGRLGDGEGKWQLFIKADQDIQAMSLLESETGHLTNLSSLTAVR